jgi:transposase-like protein
MVNCPRCGLKAGQTGKEWKYHVFDAKSFYCNQCGKKFIVYYRNGKLSHTIPKSSK